MKSNKQNSPIENQPSTSISAREAILRAVQSALQTTKESALRAKAAWEPPSAPDFTGDVEAKCRRFIAELTAVNGEAIEVGDSAALIQAAADVLEKEHETTLAVSGGELVEKTARALQVKGVRIISPLESADERKSMYAGVKVGLVEAVYGVADTGTVVLSPRLPSQWPAVLSEVLIVILKKSRLFEDHFAMVRLADRQEYAGVVWITGPSRTADIEKILILGAHGPRRLIVLLYDQE
ncbi:MAG: lactate utilization protein [candidate division KSB1 bacterium]|nr:lactate utilization protein [candidate division KSB1 bacterium]